MSAPKVTIMLIVLAILASLTYMGIVSRQAAQAGTSGGDIFQSRERALEREYRETTDASRNTRR